MLATFFCARLAGSSDIGWATLQLEQAIYAESFLQDDSRAEELLLAVHDRRQEALPQVWAEATYRLARLYESRGDFPAAREKAFALRDALGDLRDDAWERWVVGLLETNTRLPAQEAPWPEGELLTYALKTVTGEEIGFGVEWSGKVNVAGRPVHDLRNWLFVQPSNTVRAVRILAEPVADGFRPLVAKGRNTLTDDYRAEFNPEAHELRFTAGGIARSVTLPHGNLYLDIEQSTQLARLLDPDTTPVLHFHTIMPGGVVLPSRKTFTGMETILLGGREVAAEIWNCEIMDPQSLHPQTTYKTWVDPTPPRHVVRFEQGNVMMELVAASIRPDLEAVSRTVAEHGYTYRIPHGWVAHGTATPPGGQSHQVYFISPGARATGIWLISQSRPSTPLEEIVDADLARLTGLLPGYRIIDGTLSDGLHHGHASRGYQAHFTDRNQSIIEMRLYWLEKGRVHWFVFRTPEADWEDQAPLASEILASIRPLHESEPTQALP